VLALGGIHGDEPKSVFVALRLIDLLQNDATAAGATSWVVVPVVNPDGYECRKRRNANRIDLNRNFPTKNWTSTSARSRMFGGSEPASEPETRAVIAAVQRYRPDRIIAIHSIDRHRQCNNYDGPGKAIADRMSRLNGYPVTSSIGYATPGSLGTWAGSERNIPTITLELPSHYSPKRCWQDNQAALLCLQ
jgi:protein MpaA